MKLPAKITILGDPIKIIEKPLVGKKGYWDESNATIVINKNQPRVGKLIVLIHESMHVIETMLLQNKAIKKRVTHEFITNASFGMAAILIGCGAIEGISNYDLMQFLKEDEDDE